MFLKPLKHAEIAEQCNARSISRPSIILFISSRFGESLYKRGAVEAAEAFFELCEEGISHSLYSGTVEAQEIIRDAIHCRWCRIALSMR